MNILIANNHLNTIGGTEQYTYDIAKELLRRNYNVHYFTFYKGIVSSKLEKLGVRFMNLKRYDIILANHRTCVERLCHKGFIVQTCHGKFSLLEFPSFLADKHVSISLEVKNHLKLHGYQSSLIYNGIDFNSLPIASNKNQKLKYVLSLCQSEYANCILQEACRKLSLDLKILNKHINPEWDINKEINNADLVVGLGRSVYQAISMKKPVIIFDAREYNGNLGDGYLTAENIEKYLEFNCSGRSSLKKFEVDDIVNELQKYNAKDGDALCTFAQQNLNISLIIDKYLTIERKKIRSKFAKIILKLFTSNFYKSNLKRLLKK